MFRHRLAPLIVGILALCAVVGYVALHRSSPGELARPHAEVAGSSLITGCAKCHGKKGLAFGCLGCHGEIAMQLSAGTGFHGYLLRGKKPECTPCHSDHNGRDFPLINTVSWQSKDPKGFTHPQTRFGLAGRHRGLACAQCHGAKDGTFTLAGFASHKRPKTFLGLDQACVHCHKDIHAGGLAANCDQCHGQDSFRPAVVFDHGRFFALKGPHTGLACAKCHPIPAPGATVVKASAFPFDRVRGRSCWQCHVNPHRVKWDAACEDCHKAQDTAWSAADTRMKRGQHAASGFRLIAAHERAACATCHAGSSFVQKYPDPRRPGYNRREQDCQGCHRDPHLGQFAARHQRCTDCHAVRGFSPALYGVTDHKTYPLLGKHLTAGCYACHKKDPATGTRRFNGLPRACADCHKDVHGGQFGPKRDASCDSCHSPEHSWAAVAFDHNRQTQFRLVQAHSRAACDACHKMDAATGVRRYAGTPTRCSGCHKDIHFAQFRVAGQTACESCHASQQAWRDLAFDHNRQSRFKLDAAHGKLACRQCHPEVTLANGVRIIQYKPLKMECRDCHDFER